MGNKLDIHSLEKRLKNALKTLKESEILPENKKHIEKFIDYLFTIGLSNGRIERYIYIMCMISKKLGKDFSKCTKKDIMDYVRNLKMNSELKEWTKYTYLVCLKRFYKWLLGNDEKYPKCVNWIKPKAGNGKKLPEELLTEEDIAVLIKSANSLRDKALISILYESGCRIGELGNVRIKHVSFDEYGCKLTVDGKTGMRRIRLISSGPFLSQYLSVHPRKDEPDAPLWVGCGTRNKNKQLSYPAIATMIRRTAKSAGIKKRVNPHSFRHARATYLAKHLTEAQMKEYLGWVQNSDMAGVYVHLSGRDVDNAIMKLNGIEIEDKDSSESTLKPRACPRCEYENASVHKFCAKCGMALDTATAMSLDKERRKADNLMNELVKDPEVLELFKKKLEGMR